MRGQRVLWVIVALVALSLALAMGAAIGGGVVYALTRGESKLPLAAAQGRDPGYGVVVAFVEPRGPAEEAGVSRGDILLKLNSERIEGSAGLVRILSDLEPGDEVELLVLHGDEERALSLTPDERDGRAYLGLTPCGGLASDPTVQWIPPGALSSGALVVDVTSGGPAEGAGLEAGDVITAVDGQPIDVENDLADRIAAYKPGDTVTLTVERPGEEPREVTVDLGAQPEDESLVYLGLRYVPSPLPGAQDREWLPFERFRDLPFDELPFAFPEGDLAGVIVQHVVEDSPAEAAGLSAGDVITALDGDPVESAQALTESIAAHEPGDQVLVTVVRLSNGNEREVEVTLAEHPDESGKAYLGVWLGGYLRLPSTKEGQGTPRRWFFGLPYNLPFRQDSLPRRFEFRWSPQEDLRDTPSIDDVGSA
jgi:S1-C subfamily serine protease